ncbi:MAG: GNAT family N-acetyltransferase [Lentilitoribacter sp.]
MIKIAQNADLTAIKHCAELAYAPYVEAIGRKPAPMVADFAKLIFEKKVYIEKDGEQKLTGFIVFFVTDDVMHLENIAVMPTSHGKGIGRKLMKYCEDCTIALGLNEIELYTNEKMVANLAIYPKLGYKETERRLEDGFHRVYFRKTLT